MPNPLKPKTDKDYYFPSQQTYKDNYKKYEDNRNRSLSNKNRVSKKAQHTKSVQDKRKQQSI